MKFQSDFTKQEIIGLEDKTPLACRACGELCETTPFVLADAKGQDSYTIPSAPTCSVYYKCRKCKSLNDANTLQTFYSEEIDSEFIAYYADSTAGVEEMIEPIINWVRKNPEIAQNNLRFLEVGCGIGYTIDFCKNILRWDAVGLEPGAWGSFAKKMLNVDVEQAYLGGGSIYDNEKFDIIYASEVIEHILDPAAFLETIKKTCGSRLNIILTTPNADYISKDSEKGDCYSLLFPGEHKVIFTASGITRMLEECGFSEIVVETRQTEKNLVVFATYQNEKQSQNEIYEGDLSNNQLVERDFFEEYYLKSIRNEQNSTLSPIIRRGLFYRFFKRCVNAGKLEDARILLSKAYEYDCSLFPYNNDKLSCSLTIDREIFLYSNILRCCMQTLYKEWTYLELTGSAYPEGVTAFHKLLGFYTCTVIHHFVAASETSRGLYKTVRHYLSSLLGYIDYINDFPHSYYYLELLSLKGPAQSSLILTCAKLGVPFELDRQFDDKFIAKFSQSYNEIKRECEIHPFLAMPTNELIKDYESMKGQCHRLEEEIAKIKAKHKM